MTLEEYLQQQYSDSTLKSNLYNIKRFRDYYPNRSETATYQDILHYISYLRKHYDLHPKTLRHCLYGVKLYFNYLLAIGKRKDHPCRELYLQDKIDKQVAVDRLYSRGQLLNFYKSYRSKESRLITRNKTILSLLIYQGLTVRELTQLNKKDVDLESGTITIVNKSSKNTKSPKSRILPLQARQVLVLYHYIKEDREQLLSLFTKDSDTLFLSKQGRVLHPESINRIINENRDASDRIPPLRIRQSVIANLAKQTSNIRLVQEFAGHRSTTTTLQYQQTALEALAKSIENYHPLQ